MSDADPTTCLDCGTTVAGNFCPECGQGRRTARLDEREILHGLVENLFNLDSTWGDILNNFDITMEQPRWLAEQLQQARNDEDAPGFVVGAWHYPACSSQQEHRFLDRNWVNRNFIETFLDNGGIDLVLVGHDKVYERSIVRGEVPHIQTNVGLLSPGDEGNNHHDCEEVVTLPDTRSVLLGTVSDGQIALSVIDEDGAEIDALVLEED